MRKTQWRLGGSMFLVLRDELYKIAFFFQDFREKYIPPVPNFQRCAELHLELI